LIPKELRLLRRGVYAEHGRSAPRNDV